MNHHDRAAILSTGDEIVLGQLQDTNANNLASSLTDLGIVPVEHAALPDDLDALSAAIGRLAETAPLVVMSGGLGPTDGDLTRAALCRVLKCDLVQDPQATAALTAYLANRNRSATERQMRQSFRPALARCLPNAHGTAPGLHAQVPSRFGITDVFALPGPPGELRPMFETSVLPMLRPQPGRTVLTRLLHVTGLPEAECATRLADLTARDRVPLVGMTASGAVITIRIRYEGPADADGARAAIDSTEAAVRAKLGEHVFGVGTESLASTVVARLRAAGRNVALVESCTGGALGEAVTEVPGASDVFLGGLVVYDNRLKSELAGIPADTLDRCGAVSPETAAALARAGLERTGADECLAVTGIAGPGGGTPQKPVGTVFIALARRGAPGAAPDVREFRFPGGRADVRVRAVRSALSMLYFALCAPGPTSTAPAPRLLWQV
jgi:nicotinamide-nucleotide amidase